MSISRTVYIAILCLLAVSMTTSTFMTNLAWVLLAANWILEWNWKDKFCCFKDNRLLHLCVVFFLLHCVGLLWSDNLIYGLDDIRQKLPLLVVPLVVLTSKPLSRKELWYVGGCYAITVLVVSVIGLVRYISIPDLPYREIVPYISHIRFSLNVCFVIGLLIWICIQQWTGIHNRWYLLGSLCVVLIWFVGFLLLLRSYTAFFVLLLMPALFLCWGKAWRSWKGLLYGCIVALLVGLVAGFARGYFGSCTRGEDVIENGSYINVGVSESSLRAHWGDVSRMPVDALTANGYAVYPTLIRYLNSCGYPKDSSGIAMLNADDVRNIEKGIANRVYAQGLSLRSMCYVLFYEFECYRVTGSLGESSLLHRIALWRNGWSVLLQHPICGVGTGDVVDACHTQLEIEGSQLIGTGKHAHNQYLTILIAFGLLGGVLLLCFFVRILMCHSYQKSFLFLLSIAIVLLSCLSEDTFETLAGCLFACIPCLFYKRK